VCIHCFCIYFRKLIIGSASDQAERSLSKGGTSAGGVGLIATDAPDVVFMMFTKAMEKNGKGEFHICSVNLRGSDHGTF
jgi:hypothetical protein